MNNWPPKREFNFSHHMVIQNIHINTSPELVWEYLGILDYHVVGKRLTKDPLKNGRQMAIVDLHKSPETKDFISQLKRRAFFRDYSLYAICDWLNHVENLEEQVLKLRPYLNMQRKIIVSGLREVDCSKLRQEFSKAGNVSNVEVCETSRSSTGMSAEVTMEYFTEALAAVYIFHGINFEGMLLEVETKEEPYKVLIDLHQMVGIGRSSCRICHARFKYLALDVSFK